MTIILIVIHVFVSLFLIAVVLLQSGKGAEIGAAFGGSSQTLFGSRGAASFLSKMTTGAAIVFMLTSLVLAVVTSKGGSVVKKVPVSREQRSMPAAPVPLPGGGVQPVQPQQVMPKAQQPTAQSQPQKAAQQQAPAK
jgi:preprotein translocase subunit SecG